MVATGTVHLVFGIQVHQKYNRQCKGFVVMGIYDKHVYLSGWAGGHNAAPLSPFFHGYGVGQWKRSAGPRDPFWGFRMEAVGG